MILLTGATGFLGMEVLARLLERGDEEILCLVRAPDDAAAQERLDGVLATLYDDPAPYRGRARALRGDVTEPITPPDAHVDVVCHCAASITFDLPLDEARRINVAGTKRLLECCATYGVKKLVVLSSCYVYGALPESPYYMDEDTALNVSRHYPDIRDLAEVDTLCNTFLWKYPEIATAILRPVPTLGYYVHSSIGGYLKLRYVPTIMGFNPMVQFIHEEDLAEAIGRTLETGIRGIFK